MPNRIIVELKDGGYICPRREDYFIRTGAPQKIGDEAIIWTFNPLQEHRVILLETVNGYRWLVKLPDRPKRRTSRSSNSRA